MNEVDSIVKGSFIFVDKLTETVDLLCEEFNVI
jgi:hypothetical protein